MKTRGYGSQGYEQVTEAVPPGGGWLAGGSGAHRQRHSKPLLRLLLLGALGLAPAGARAEAGLALGVQELNSANEPSRTAFLTWTAETVGIYQVQSSTNLGDPAAWKTEDAVSQSTVGPLKWMAPEALEVQKYYRLILPQPEIFAVEPAVIAPGVAVEAWVIGQSFASSDVVQVDGAVAGSYVDSGSFALPLPAQSAGTHRVELVRDGVVVSSFNVTCADALANPELVLQGPPTEPPASPSVKAGSLFLSDGTPVRAKMSTSIARAGRIMVGNANGPGSINSLGYVSANTKSVSISVNGGNTPTVGRAAGSNGGGQGVMPFSGEVQECVVDMVIPGRGLDFAWARTYHSRIGRYGAAANGWTFSYDVRCAQDSSGGIDLYDGTGRKDMFILRADGTYACPELFREVTYIAGVVRVTFADTGYWEFNPFDGTATAGKLAQIVDRNGNTMSLEYDTSSGLLTRILDDLGRTNSVAYTSDGQVASVTDFTGRSVTYQYYQGLTTDEGGAGDLQSVTSPPVTDFPDGKTTTYGYSKDSPLEWENHLLLSVTDPKGQTAAAFTYGPSAADPTNYLHCLTAQEGTNPPSCYRWALVSRPAGSYATVKCIANDPVGNVTEYYCDARNRCVLERDYTGRATPGLPVTDTVNRPTGKVRDTDPDYYDTQWAWNNDSLCTVAVAPAGQQVHCVYQSDFDPATPARKRADCRVVRELASSAVDLDGDGVADVTDRAWYYTYDPRFGSPAPDGLCRAVADTTGTFNPSKWQVMASLSQGTGSPRAWEKVDNSAGVISNMRTRINALEASLKSLGLLAPRVAGANGWDGTATQKRFGIGGGSPDSPLGRVLPTVNKRGGLAVELFFDGYEEGRMVPAGNGMAIKTKGTGADKNRVLPTVNKRTGGAAELFFDGYEEKDDCRARLLPTVNKRTGGAAELFFDTYEEKDDCRARLLPTVNKHAINTKGTGTAGRSLPSLKTDPYAGADFATSVTDPRGNVTKGAYDTRGNRVKVQFFWDRQSSADLDFSYDTHGQCIAITNLPDANGQRRVDTFSYYASGSQAGYLQSIAIDEPGVHLTTALEYDARGNVTRVIDPRTNDWLFTYNALDQCVRRTTPNNSFGSVVRCSTDYAYDANDNLVQGSTELLDSTGNLLGNRINNYQYDAEDRLSQIALAMDASHALTNRFVYDGNNQCVQVLGADAVSGADPNQTIAYQYDERGLLFQAVAAPGSTLAATRGYDYDANGNTARINKIEAISIKQTIISRDGFDRLTSATDPMGNQTLCFYDANDNLKVVRQLGELNDVAGSAGNIRLAESRYDYDGLDRCVVQHDLHFNLATQTPVGDGEATTRFAFAPCGQCSSSTDDLGHTTTFGYDTAGRPASVSSPDGRTVVVVVRDACGNVTSSMQTDTPDLGGPAQAFSVTKVYDALNRCVSSTDSAGNTSSFAYDSLDRVIRVTDPNGNDTTYAYDLLDNGLASTDYAGSSSGTPVTVLRSNDATYDLNSRCIATTDANGNTTSYAYDSLGDCTAVTFADGTQQQLVWSPHGNLMQETDANGTVSMNTYDLNDRIVHRDLATRLEAFTYDGCDRLTGETDNDCDGTFAYDSLGNRVSETLSGLATTSTYDALGNRLSLTYPGGRALAYTYDSNNRCTSITESGAALASFSYAGLDRVERCDYGNGTRASVAYDGLAGTANAAGDYGFGQVRRIRHEVAAKGLVIDDRTFGYEPDQNKASRDMTSPFTLGGVAQTMTFQYDPLCRLVGALVTTNGAQARLTTYGLDRVGNRTNVTGAASCSGDYTMSSTVPPGDFQMNQYSATPCDARAYDDNGNLTNRVSAAGPVTYEYDYADRLVRVSDYSTGTLSPVASYSYDALGRRVSKTLYSGGVPTGTNLFLYDGGSVIEERENSAVAATYLLDDRYLLGLRRGGQDYFVHTDDQDNALALTGAGGAVLERYDYDDYGAVTFLGADGTPLVGSDGLPVTSSPAGNVYCWGGLRLDAETGLHNDDSGGYFEPQSGTYFSRPPRPHFSVSTTGSPVAAGMAIRGKVKSIKADPVGFLLNNPWSGGGGGGALASESIVFRPSRCEIK